MRETGAPAGAVELRKGSLRDVLHLNLGTFKSSLLASFKPQAEAEFWACIRPLDVLAQIPGIFRNNIALSIRTR